MSEKDITDDSKKAITIDSINSDDIFYTSLPSISSIDIKDVKCLVADEAKFKDMKIKGNLEVDGKIRAEQIEMNETQIILNIDYNKITEYMENMDSKELEFFIGHLNKLKLMAERELLIRL